ncbi:MAG: hypothetical protein QW035_04065 [Candidatus Anstonellales archaeon]
MGKFPQGDKLFLSVVICRKCKTRNKRGVKKCRKCHSPFLRIRKKDIRAKK